MATTFKGKGLSLLVGTEEVNLEATSVVLESEDADSEITVFADLDQSSTAKQWFFTIEAIADYAADSFHTFLWTNAGGEYSFTFKPYGNAVASTTQPHFTGTLEIPSKPNVGGTAGEAWTFETRLNVVGDVARVTA